LPPPAPSDRVRHRRYPRTGDRLALIALVAAAAMLPPPAAAQPRPAAAPSVVGDGNRIAVPVALTFMVSVCLADFEYSIGCSQRSSLEAAQRLEQIFLDDYKTGSAAGSLRIWFAVKAQPSEQTSLLHEVENRAIESVYRKLKEDAAQQAAAAAGSAAVGSAGSQGNGAETAREFAEDIERWHNDADGEARSGVNWSHDWAGRAHTYKPGQALRDLARIGNRHRQSSQSDN
jgi:hypothetical protein